MSKMNFVTPKIEVIRLEFNDVLTMSGGEETGGDEPP